MSVFDSRLCKVQTKKKGLGWEATTIHLLTSDITYTVIKVNRWNRGNVKKRFRPVKNVWRIRPVAARACPGYFH